MTSLSFFFAATLIVSEFNPLADSHPAPYLSFASAPQTLAWPIPTNRHPIQPGSKWHGYCNDDPIRKTDLGKLPPQSHSGSSVKLPKSSSAKPRKITPSHAKPKTLPSAAKPIPYPFPGLESIDFHVPSGNGGEIEKTGNTPASAAQGKLTDRVTIDTKKFWSSLPTEEQRKIKTFREFYAAILKRLGPM